MDPPLEWWPNSGADGSLNGISMCLRGRSRVDMRLVVQSASLVVLAVLRGSPLAAHFEGSLPPSSSPTSASQAALAVGAASAASSGMDVAWTWMMCGAWGLHWCDIEISRL